MSRGQRAIIRPQMEPMRRGGMTARLARSDADMAQVMALRAKAWPGDATAMAGDRLDLDAAHLMIIGRDWGRDGGRDEVRGGGRNDGSNGGGDGALLATMRVLVTERAAEESYSARFYDLSTLAAAYARTEDRGRANDGAPDSGGENGQGATDGATGGANGRENGGAGRIMLEPGRFAASPAAGWEALRLTWAALARLTLTNRAECLFGCASFAGADWRRHRAALALLAAAHLGPAALRPGRLAAELVEYPALAGPAAERKAALAALPPMLRFYLGLGGWVSDHAVVDRQLDTLHVFTCVELSRMPKPRKEALRALASD